MSIEVVVTVLFVLAVVSYFHPGKAVVGRPPTPYALLVFFVPRGTCRSSRPGLADLGLGRRRPVYDAHAD